MFHIYHKQQNTALVSFTENSTTEKIGMKKANTQYVGVCLTFGPQIS